MNGTLSDEAFAALVAAIGFKLDAEELKLLREGYDGLQDLLGRLPDAPPLADEPAFVQLPPGARITA